MCGIAGWADSLNGAASPEVLRRMSDAIAHRGPDGAGHFQAGTRDNRHGIALAHRRLAIIDLSTGQQPMHSADGRLTLVFNGEIYNFQELRQELQAMGYRFATSSDTEVILYAYAAWGTFAVRRLRGMFAFALWDADRELLLLARDPFGKKPLYLWQDGARLIFGSEIKSLLAHPGVTRRLDHASVLDYMSFRYVPAPHTLFEGVSKLPPGAFAVWQDGTVRIDHYFTPPDATHKPRLPNGMTSVGMFTKKLDECVRIRMVSDVPFGAFLSGGIDSSAVVALMSRHLQQPVKTFSVGYAEANYSELRYAKMVAERFRTDHHELIISARSIMDHWPQLIRYRDAPVAEPADIPIYLLSAEAAKSVKMVLTGEGSDEFLAGYPKHKAEGYVPLYQALVPEAAHRHVVEPILARLPYRFRRLKTAAAAAGLRDPMERLPRWFGALSQAERNRLIALDAPKRLLDSGPFIADPSQTALRKILTFDQTSWLPDNLLERGDRMTMAASIEGRMPFMDQELAALMAALPDHCRIQGGEQKWILREAMKDILPAEILHRPKSGFRMPINEWFRTDMRSFVYDHLTGPGSMTASWYHAQPLHSLLAEHMEGRVNHEKLIWMLLALELFQREYRLS